MTDHALALVAAVTLAGFAVGVLALIARHEIRLYQRVVRRR